jgi:hypothetical protein
MGTCKEEESSGRHVTCLRLVLCRVDGQDERWDEGTDSSKQNLKRRLNTQLTAQAELRLVQEISLLTAVLSSLFTRWELITWKLGEALLAFG